MVGRPLSGRALALPFHVRCRLTKVGKGHRRWRHRRVTCQGLAATAATNSPVGSSRHGAIVASETHLSCLHLLEVHQPRGGKCNGHVKIGRDRMDEDLHSHTQRRTLRSTRTGRHVHPDLNTESIGKATKRYLAIFAVLQLGGLRSRWASISRGTRRRLW